MIDIIKVLVLITMIIVFAGLFFIYFITFIFAFFKLLINGRKMRNDLKSELPEYKPFDSNWKIQQEEGLEKLKNWCRKNNRRDLLFCMKLLIFDRKLLNVILICLGGILIYGLLFFI